MDDENKYTIQDLINFSADQKPIEFADAFKDVIADRLAAAVDTRKFELASSLYNGRDDDDDQEELDFEDEDENDDEFGSADFDEDEIEEYEEDSEEEVETDGEAA